MCVCACVRVLPPHPPPPCTCTATDYMKKDQFLANFWEGFCEVLGPNHTIKSLEK